MIISLLWIYFISQGAINASPISSRFIPTSNDTERLAYPSDSDTVPYTGSCPQLRTTWDILWSCLTTIFACTWVSIHPNSPGPKARRLRVILGRVELMIWVILIPEMVISWALRQWLGARELREYYKVYPPTEFGWSMVHAHFLQMGGFMLVDGDSDKEVLSPETFRKLLQEGRIRFPHVSQEEVSAFSKGDGLSKIIVVGQTSWFIAQCLSRAVQGLTITELELVTVTFAFFNALMYFLWWDKPLDSSSTIRVPLCPDLIPVFLSPWDDYTQNSSTVFTTVWPVSQQESNASSVLKSRHSRRRTDMPIEYHGGDTSQDLEMHQSRRGRNEDAVHSGNSQNHRIAVDESYESSTNNPSPYRKEVSGALKAFALIMMWKPLLLLGYICRLVVKRIRQVRMTWEVPSGAMAVPPFYASSRPIFNDVMKNMYCSSAICFIGVIIGAIHSAGWILTFPSRAEMIIWRVNSTIIFAYPSVFVLVLVTNMGCYMMFKTHKNSGFSYQVIVRGTRFLSLLLAGLPMYLLAKTILLVEAFIALRRLPEGAFVDVQWTRPFPYI